MSDTLLTVRSTSLGIEPFLEQHGRIFRAFREQDSGCVAFGVEGKDGQRWFVKHANTRGAVGALRNAQLLYESLPHPAMPRVRNAFATAGEGFALVLDWVDGEVLYDYVAHRAGGRKHDPASAFVRFRALPAEKIIKALGLIYDVHRLLAERGYIAVDFYDGCVIYDFAAATTHLCDFDHYHNGPFVLDAERLPGSTRFMAPEEFVRGSTIDQVTNVFTLGRTALEFLGGASDQAPAWRGSQSMLDVVRRATNPDRAQRYPTVGQFVESWWASRV